MKPILIFISFLFSLQLSAQHIFPATIKNEKKKQHIHIPGCRFSIILPKGYTLERGEIGIKKKDRASIQFIETKDPELNNNLSKELFEQVKNPTDTGNINWGIYKAKFIVFDRNYFRYCFICFGDSSFSAVINATWALSDSLINTADSSINQEMIDIIQTIHFDKAQKYDPFEAAVFTLDESKSIFKFSEYDMGVFTYTPDRKKENPDDKTNTKITISMQTVDDTTSTISQVSEYFANMIIEDKTYHIYDTKILSDLPVNNYNAYELLMYGLQKIQPLHVYQLIMIHNKVIVNLTAYIRTDHENYLKEAKKLAASIKFK